MVTIDVKTIFCSFMHVTTLTTFFLLLSNNSSVHAATSTDTRQDDPLVGFNYALEVKEQVVGIFTTVGGIGSESEVINESSQKIPGRLIWHDVTLSKGVTSNLYLWTWRKQVEDGDMLGARRDFNIVMLNQVGEELARWNFSGGWPSKIAAPRRTQTEAMNAAVEEITIVHMGGYLQQPASGSCGQKGDGDGDGVCNDTDNCPVATNPGQADADIDGFGDECDACSNDANKTDPGSCGCGIADVDSDYDGAMDCVDLDDDNDGLSDQDEAKSGTDPLNPDTDGDGVEDGKDRCPLNNATGQDANADGCIDAIEGLSQVVQNIDLPGGTDNSLRSKIANAQTSIESGNTKAAIKKLKAFISQVKAQRGKKITEEDATTLIEYANNLIDALSI